jgi:tight adherence protein C
MTHWTSLGSMVVFLTVFLGTCAVGFAVFLRAYGDRKRALTRLRNLAVEDSATADQAQASVKQLVRTTLPKLGNLLFSNKQDRLAPLKRRLLQAGFYGPNFLGIFLGTKLVLMLVLPLLAATIPYLLGNLSLKWALTISLSASAMGMIAPGIWLDAQVRKRHRALRQALPDALDMLVLCLEGGLSMTAAFQRVTGELNVVYPVLGGEMNIMQREVQLGLSTGEALKKMGDRCGLEDVRDLASVLLQSERFGASMVKALRQHAESWRQERQQRAEEQAHKSAVKILFPTLLCIFPAIFIVLLGPAAFQMAALFSK